MMVTAGNCDEQSSVRRIIQDKTQDNNYAQHDSCRERTGGKIASPNEVCQEETARRSAVQPHGVSTAQKPLDVEDGERRESGRKGDRIDGDESKEIQRIVKVIVKERLINEEQALSRGRAKEQRYMGK
ncbi:hypothetical protein K438DRAFT_1765894 [Mycena galopus ATCC 62051]|nr:hypothetical protein K438DRAFT_1765894 [Mycena galopus ATCC 62051]